MTLAGARERPAPPAGGLGHPRVHARRIDSTNDRARQLAIAGAPHGTAVTAAEQSAGRGRQGRAWLAPPAGALLCSLVLRDPPPLLSLIAGVAVCEALDGYPMAGQPHEAHDKRALLKWPNDVVVERPGTAGGAPGQTPAESEQPTLAKLAGILVEGRPQEGWAVLGIGLNVALQVADLPAELHGRAASLELEPSAIEPLFERLLETLLERLSEQPDVTLDAWRARDALYGRQIAWGAHGAQSRGERGQAEGIDRDGRLLIRSDSGAAAALSAGEVHLESVG
jgi:BirA family biotin operon repressor/biotin-[acetyl-CoA-carboxylase] ligase